MGSIPSTPVAMAWQDKTWTGTGTANGGTETTKVKKKKKKHTKMKTGETKRMQIDRAAARHDTNGNRRVGSGCGLLQDMDMDMDRNTAKDVDGRGVIGVEDEDASGGLWSSWALGGDRGGPLEAPSLDAVALALEQEELEGRGAGSPSWQQDPGHEVKDGKASQREAKDEELHGGCITETSLGGPKTNWLDSSKRSSSRHRQRLTELNIIDGASASSAAAKSDGDGAGDGDGDGDGIQWLKGGDIRGSAVGSSGTGVGIDSSGRGNTPRLVPSHVAAELAGHLVRNLKSSQRPGTSHDTVAIQK